MPWLVESEDYHETILEIEHQTDRAAALIAAGLLEERLLGLLKARMFGDPTTQDKMFKGYGPLASFSAKIDLGYLLGLYDAEMQQRLHTIRNIRNEFAHSVRPIDFGSQKVKALCTKLIPTEKFMEVYKDTLAKNASFRKSKVMWDAMLKPTEVPGKRFMNAIKVCLFILTSTKTCLSGCYTQP